MGWVEGRVMEYLCSVEPVQCVEVGWSHHEAVQGVLLPVQQVWSLIPTMLLPEDKV